MNWNTKCSLVVGCISEYDKGYQDGSKETVKRIIAKIKQFLNGVETVRNNDENNLQPEIGYKCSGVDDFLDKLEKEEVNL